MKILQGRSKWTRMAGPVLCVFIWFGTASAQAGVMDSISGGASYLWQGAKNKAKGAATYITDSPAGKYVSPSERNKRDKERILSVLAYDNTIVRHSDGTIVVTDQSKLDKYYRSLQSSKALNNVYGFSPKEDPTGTQSGQFWKNFFDGKDHARGDAPASMDPFETNGRGLATAMHTELAAATGTGNDPDLADYADAATTLKVRGIDILEKDLRQGVAAGADVYIKALDAITAGKSSQAVKWMEDAAKTAKEISDDPKAAAEGYVKGKVEDQVNDLKGQLKDKIGEYKSEMLTKADEALKSAMGEDAYNDLMAKYEKYGEGQERLQKIFEDLAKVTGDDRLKEAAKKIAEFSPEKIADDLSKKYLPEILQGDDGKDEEGDGEEADKGEKTDDVNKDKTAEGDKTDKGPEAQTPPESPTDTVVTEPDKTDESVKTGEKTGTEEDTGISEPPEKTDETDSAKANETDKPDSTTIGAGDGTDSEVGPDTGSGEKPEGETADNDNPDDSNGDSSDAEPGTESEPAGGDKPGETTTSSGYVEDSSGRITLGETRGPDGSLIKTTTTETDKDGNIIGQTTYEGGTGEGKTTTPGGGLRDSEPESDADVPPELISGGVNTSGSFADNWSKGQNQDTADGTLIMANNTQMGDAANVGNQQIDDAGNVRDSGGRDSQTIGENSTRDTEKADGQDSWGKALGDAVENGITEGGKSFGQALGGAAADKAVGAIFGTPDSDESGDGGGDGSKEVTETGGTGQTASSGSVSGKSKKSPKSDGSNTGCTDGDNPSSNSGGNEPSDSGTGNGDTSDTSTPNTPTDDPLGVTDSSENDDGTVTIHYGCGYSWTGTAPGPSRCPICSRETVSTDSNSSPPDEPGGSTDDTEITTPSPPVELPATKTVTRHWKCGLTWAGPPFPAHGCDICNGEYTDSSP